MFYNIAYSKESIDQTSKINKDEAEVVLRLFADACKIMRKDDSKTGIS